MRPHRRGIAKDNMPQKLDALSVMGHTPKGRDTVSMLSHVLKHKTS